MRTLGLNVGLFLLIIHHTSGGKIFSSFQLLGKTGFFFLTVTVHLFSGFNQNVVGTSLPKHADSVFGRVGDSTQYSFPLICRLLHAYNDQACLSVLLKRILPRGRYFRNFWVGMCRWDPRTLSPCQS